MKELRNGGTRREILAGGVAAGILGASSLAAQTPSSSNAASPVRKVSITVDGVTYRYPDGPKLPSYSVNIRSDGAILFRLGSLGDLTAPGSTVKPYQLGPHHVKIESETAVLLDRDVPAHWWHAQWTFRPAPITVKRTPAQLVAANRMFRFGDTGCRVGGDPGFKYSGPMDSAGITKNMPQTGERPDIGWTTDAVAVWMLGGSPNSMLAWAQAADSVPINYVDDKTGKPIDLTVYPNANNYPSPGAQGRPWIAGGAGNGWDADISHFPSMTYAAFETTHDIGFLHNLQHAANFSSIDDAYSCSPTVGAVVNFEQTRQLAWGFRNLFEAHIATKDAEALGILPPDLHPSGYFKRLLDNNLKFYSSQMKEPRRQTPRLLGPLWHYSPWQVDYLLTSLAFGVLTGHGDWTQLYLWVLGNAVARTSNKSGYPPGLGTLYRLNSVRGGDANTNPNPTMLTWAQVAPEMMNDTEARLSQAQIDALARDPLNGGVPLANPDGGYMMTTRAVLVMADHLDKSGLAPVRASYPELDACLKIADRMVRTIGIMQPRVSVVS